MTKNGDPKSETSDPSVGMIKALIKKRGSTKGRLTLFKRFLDLFESESASETERRELKLRINGLPELYKEFNEVQDKIEELISDSEIATQLEARFSFDSEYYRLLAKAQTLNNCDEFYDCSNPQNQNQNQNSSVSVKLPIISLPTFNGSYEYWLEFRDTFMSLVHNNKNIDNFSKMHYLKQSLTNDAKSVIDSIEVSSDNYRLAWELLLDRYDNNRLLIHTHVKSIVGMQSLAKESPELIRRFVDTIMKNLRALKILGENTDQWDTLVIYLVVSKLDNKTEREWEQHKGDLVSKQGYSKYKIKLSDLLQFLRNRADMLETILLNHTQPKATTALESKKHNVHCNVAAEKVRNTNNNNNNTRKPFHLHACFSCGGKHPLYSCQNFLNLSIDDRYKVIRDNKLCENCFKFGHLAVDCRYGPCRKCDKKHNSLLHAINNAVQGQTETRSVALLSTNAILPDGNLSNHTHTQNTDVQCAHTSSKPYALLPTAIVEIPDNLGRYHKARALLDCGSERSFITQELCNKINPQIIQSTQTISGVGGSLTHSTQICKIQIRSLTNSFIAHTQCFVLPQITSTLPSITIDYNVLNIPEHIQLADPTFYNSQAIDILLGVDILWDLFCEGKIRLTNGPFLQNTQLGWIVSGPILSMSRNRNKIINCHFTQSVDNLNSIEWQLQKFWEIEDLPISRKLGESRNEEELACENLFVKTTKRVENGRFSVRIPFKHNPDTLGESYTQAKKRFLALENRLDRNLSYKAMYRDFIHEYRSLGHMRRITAYDTPHYFMPHHGVFREHSTTTKLRVVFDASAVTSSGHSLNSLQSVGAPIQGDLISILLRFRENRFIACADIEKFYRQVLVESDQLNLQLILWRDKKLDPIDVYQLLTVTYGTASAPFLSCRCLKALAEECKDDPEVYRAINESFYVDDFIHGASQIEDLKRVCAGVERILDTGCFKLRKWVYNFDCNDEETASKELSLGDHTHSKTLGLGWYNKSDELHFHTKFDHKENTLTKRIILSSTSQIFDPLGLLSPTIIIAKVLMQKLWLLKIDWDDPVPEDVAQVWDRFVSNLSVLNSLRVPRYIIGIDTPTRLELHIFTDASQTAYGACAYMRAMDTESSVSVRLLCSKGRVAPLVPTTIPRLELCGALVGARLFKKISESLHTKFDTVVFWTDSTIVLGWLRMSPNLLKTYVQNRVAEIHEHTHNCPWRHVRGAENPADIISRGHSLDALQKSDLWWHGPSFLRDSEFECTQENSSIPSDLPEVKSNSISVLVSGSAQDGSWFPFERFSQFRRMKRAAAYLLRFIHNSRNKQDRRTGELTATELKESILLLAKLAQRDMFPDEYDDLKGKKPFKGTHYLGKLNVFLDQSDIIRVGGRIEYSNQFGFDKKHPILLQSKHWFTRLLFRYEHHNLLHAGPQLLLYTLREQWWPLGGRNLAKQTVHKCIKCARHLGKTVSPLMGNLPSERLEAGFPFVRCGVDYAGPVLILNRKGRGARTVKAYICLFICFTTRAIHLELVTDLSSEAYVLALKRFIARRGKPSEIFSDNGKNFVGAKNEFAKFLSNCSPDIINYATEQNIVFKMIPPYASHFGGLWEAGVKSCKHHLRRVIGDAHLTFEEFSSVLSQTEAILNSRPLTPMSPDPNDFLPLSPAHFLIGRPLTAPSTAAIHDVPANRLTRYERVEQIRQHFWSRWSKEYISELQERTKWKDNKDDLNKDTLVLIKDDNLPPLKWSLGRIITCNFS